MSEVTRVATPREEEHDPSAGAPDGAPMQELPGWLARDAATLRAHPAFQDALRTYAGLMTRKLENAPDRVRVASEEALLLIGIALSAMHLTRDPADPRSGATLTRAQVFAARTGLASPSRVAALIGLKKRMGHWRQVDVSEDRRIKRLEPTAKGEHLAGLYARTTLTPVQLLSSGADYLTLLQTDPDFQGRFAAGAVNQYLGGVRALRAAPDVSYFMRQVAGRQIMFRLWLAFVEQDNGSRIITCPYERLAASFTVSRGHVRRMVEAGQARGLFVIHAPGGQAIEILPKFVALQEMAGSLVFAQIRQAADTAAAMTGRGRIAWDM